MDEELRNKNEILIADVGDTAEPELQEEAKKKRVKRIIIFSVIILLVIAAIVVVFFWLKKSDAGGDEASNEKCSVLFSDSQISKPYIQIKNMKLSN
jgi:flagellar basal body-associated protein FliL